MELPGVPANRLEARGPFGTARPTSHPALRRRLRESAEVSAAAALRLPCGDLRAGPVQPVEVPMGSRKGIAGRPTPGEPACDGMRRNPGNCCCAGDVDPVI